MKFAPLWQTSDSDKVLNAKGTTEAVIGAFEAGVIDQATALKELRASSDDTGIFSSITDEQIAEAELEPAPAAPTEVDPISGLPATPEVAPAVEAKPSLTQRIMAWVKAA